MATSSAYSKNHTEFIGDVYHSPARKQLVMLLGKFLHNYYSQQELHYLLDNGRKTDKELLAVFKQKMGSTETSPEELRKINIKRGQRRLAEIKKVLGFQLVDEIRQLSSTTKYLDLGSNDCTISKYIGLGTGFQKNSIYATDIIEPSVQAQSSCQEVQFQKTDGKSIPFDSDQFSFVTCLQVLHHMVELDSMLNELVRVMKNNGILVIREQDAVYQTGTVQHKTMSKLFDIEHFLYDVLLGNQSLEEFFTSYYSNFHCKIAWDQILGNKKFEFIKIGHIRTFNPTNYYYSVYRLKK